MGYAVNINPSVAETITFQEIYVNTWAADDMVPCVARTLPVMVSIM